MNDTAWDDPRSVMNSHRMRRSHAVFEQAMSLCRRSMTRISKTHVSLAISPTGLRRDVHQLAATTTALCLITIHA